MFSDTTRENRKNVSKVLILVVMEYVLRRAQVYSELSLERLNPCCNGIWSQTTQDKCLKEH